MTKANLILATLFLVLSATLAVAQTSTFTYQGRFTDGGTAANNTYDMQFKLFDGAGNQIGSTITNSAVTVTDGVFTVQLDYGAAAFTGADRFLEIGVRLAGNGEAYAVLSPRQTLTSTPYAIRAGSTISADTAMTATNASQLGGVAASQYVQTNDSRLTDARPPAGGSANYIQNTNSAQAASFNINGNGAVAGALSAGTINSALDYNIGGLRVLSILGTANTLLGVNAGINMSSGINNTFVGTKAGSSNKTGIANTFVGKGAGDANTTASFNSFFGSEAGASNTTGTSNAFFGASAGTLNDTGFANSFFGSVAGYNNTTGYANSFFGKEAGVENSTGERNSYFGSFAGYRNESSNNNAFFGSFTGSNNIGPGNSFFGANSGSANITGSNNTLIGFAADVASANLDHATAIGSGAVVASSNTIVLGRSDGSDLVRLPGTVSLGTLAPAGSVSLCRNTFNFLATCSSSLRYKTNIQPFIGGLSVLNRLRPITFDWKQGGMHDLGFGAEEIAAIEPLLVTRNDKGEVEGVKYDRISAVLVNAVKEQQEQIKRQQSEIESLKRLVCRRNRRAPVCK